MILMKKLRKEKGMTMKQLGEAIGYSESAVCRWEHGNRGVKSAILKAIAEVLEYDGALSELLEAVEE